MLYEIQSDRFKIGQKVREPFRFHKGLNAIIGGDEADNSIGKSTLLLAIDFAFGGNAYLKSDVLPEIKDHKIFFTFVFDNQYFYFMRDTAEKNIVYFCEKDYSSPFAHSLEEFRQFLLRKYNIRIANLKFSFVTSRYFRIWKKDNYTTDKPLHVVPEEKNQVAVTELQKLFGILEKLHNLVVLRDEANDKKKAFTQARKNKVIYYGVTNKELYLNNLKTIKILEEKYNKLILSEDAGILNIEDRNNDLVSQLNSKLTSLRREKYRYNSKIRTIESKIKDEILPNQYDIDKLNEFFPNQINVEKLNEVQNFHKGINKILISEMKSTISRYEDLIRTIDKDIEGLKKQITELGIPQKLSISFIKEITDLHEKINGLKAQNKAYDDQKFYLNDYKEKQKKLDLAREKFLREIENKINSELSILNHYIYFEDNRKPPYISLTGDSYNYITPNDGGTGTTYKSLIIFDLAILRLTVLPAIAHDSFLLKNLGDAPIDKIIELYNKEEKQIFISFDKLPAYSSSTQKILTDAKVVKLGTGDNALFGYTWADK